MAPYKLKERKDSIGTDEDVWTEARSQVCMRMCSHLKMILTRYPHMQIDANAQPKVEVWVLSDPQNP